MLCVYSSVSCVHAHPVRECIVRSVTSGRRTNDRASAYCHKDKCSVNCCVPRTNDRARRIVQRQVAL